MTSAKMLQHSHWHSHTAIAIQSAGGGVGLVLFAALYEILLQHFCWHQALLVVSAVLLNLLVCGSLIRARPVNRGAAELRSSDVQSSQVQTAQPFCAARTGLGLVSSEQHYKKGASSQLDQGQLLKLRGGSFQLLKSANFLILFFSTILDAMATSTFFTFIPTYLKHSADHLGPIYTELLIIIGAVSIAGRLLVALMSNQLHRSACWLIFAMGHFLQGTMILCLILLPASRVAIHLSAALFALSAGVCSTLLCCICQHACQSQQELFKVYGYSVFAWGLGSSIGPVIRGLIPIIVCIF